LYLQDRAALLKALYMVYCWEGYFMTITHLFLYHYVYLYSTTHHKL